MNKSFKKITALTLSLALLAGNAVNFLSNQNTLTAKAADSVLTVQGSDKNILYYDDEMFTDCEKLKGDTETTYKSQNTDSTYARIDGGNQNPGYFTNIGIEKNDSFTIADETAYFDAKDQTLHLTGKVNNSYELGIILPEGVRSTEVEHIVADKGSVLPEKCNCLFSFLPYLKSVDLKNADTSNVTDMSYMFCAIEYYDKPRDFFMYPRSYSIDFDFGNINTQNVTNMRGMFYGVSSDKIDLTGLDTSSVTDMSNMFEKVSANKIDLSGLDTSNLTTMQSMFAGTKTPSLDLRGLDTSNVTDMSLLFYYAEIPSPDLSDLNTSNVTDMSFMFYNSKVVSVDLNSFDTRNVNNMESMFSGCKELITLDLSSFDTRNVTNMCTMFSNSSSLKTIYVSDKWTTANLDFITGYYTPYGRSFENCTNLTGGSGTVYNPQRIDAKFGHIDGGSRNPGYMTFKNDRNDIFKTQNLVLSGQIGINFNLDLSTLTDQEKAESYMEFTINGKTTVDYFDEKSKNTSGQYYSFTCYVTSVEMADTITAVYHFCDGETISKKYSVLDYIKKIEENASSYDNTTLALVRSIADYGHYSQPFLSANNNWTIGKEHKEMTKYYTNSYSYDTLKKETSEFQREINLGKSDINSITFSLSLNTETTLNVFIKPKTNYNGSIKITTRKNNSAKTYNAVKQTDGRYKVTIPNISAHQLGDTYTITTATNNGTATCSLSALSYVYATLNGSSYDKNAKDAVSALYKYYDATMNYRNK